jgi:hypothetical protein
MNDAERPLGLSDTPLPRLDDGRTLHMDRIPAWAPWLAAVIFVALAVWSATDENWSGVIVGGVLAAVCVGFAVRGGAPR